MRAEAEKSEAMTQEVAGNSPLKAILSSIK